MREALGLELVRDTERSSILTTARAAAGGPDELRLPPRPGEEPEGRGDPLAVDRDHVVRRRNQGPRLAVERGRLVAPDPTNGLPASVAARGADGLVRPAEVQRSRLRDDLRRDRTSLEAHPSPLRHPDDLSEAKPVSPLPRPAPLVLLALPLRLEHRHCRFGEVDGPPAGPADDDPLATARATAAAHRRRIEEQPARGAGDARGRRSALLVRRRRSRRSRGAEIPRFPVRTRFVTPLVVGRGWPVEAEETPQGVDGRRSSRVVVAPRRSPRRGPRIPRPCGPLRRPPSSASG